MKKFIFFFTATAIAILSLTFLAQAQQYKLKQSNSMMGMKTESTIYVKGMRKRTEPGSMMGMPAQPTTIEQCDLQRIIKINDKKKLYFIEPFSKETEEVIDEDIKPVTPAKNKPVTTKPVPQTGGIIYMYYNITDTGERKKISGFTARHIWTSQKIKPTLEACSMKDSIIIKTDGWYIDLPQFNCPVQYRPTKSMLPPNEKVKPDCKDKFVTRRSGKGKLGFALSETRTMIMGNGKSTEFETTLETIEFSTEKLDSMLFEIPPGYTQTMNEDELQNKMDINEMMNKYNNMNDDNVEIKTEQKKEGIIRIGVFEPNGGEGQLESPALQQHLVNKLKNNKIEAVAVATEEDARKYNCDYTLASEFIKIKQANKVGGMLKAIKNADPNASISFNIEATQTLIKLSDGSTRLQPKINGKYDGKIDAAAMKAMDDGSTQVLNALK